MRFIALSKPLDGSTIDGSTSFSESCRNRAVKKLKHGAGLVTVGGFGGYEGYLAGRRYVCPTISSTSSHCGKREPIEEAGKREQCSVAT